jgi:putative membrane protein
VLLAIAALAVILSGISPRSRAIWLLEEVPIFVGVPLLVLTRRRFPLTPLSYRLIFVHALLIIVGSHTTYTLQPVGVWLKDSLDLSRNPYDRVVHAFGGVSSAIVGREILRRRTPLGPGGWLFFLVSIGCLGGAAFYELLEWLAALLVGVEATAFLATQGDVWDTQWDMFLGLAGAMLAQWALAGTHERQLAALAAPYPRGRTVGSGLD